MEDLQLKVPANINAYSSTSSSLGSTGQSGAEASRTATAVSGGEDYQRRLVEIEEKLKVYEDLMIVPNKEMEKMSTQAERNELLQQEDRKRVDTLEKKVKHLELQVSALELMSYDGTFIWKISDFSRRRQEAISGKKPSIDSTPFYTSKTGYKMCARIYLNGDGMGRGTHVSLFFVIMRGQYDAMLRWPFRQKVTFIFIDQNGRDHVIDAFMPDATSTSFQRPTTDMNIESGCPLFLPLAQFDNPTIGYVKDNTAFIKVIVSVEDLP